MRKTEKIEEAVRCNAALLFVTNNLKHVILGLLNRLKTNLNPNIFAFFVLALLVGSFYGKTYHYNYSLLEDDVHTEGNRNLLKLSAANMQKVWTENYDSVYTPMAYTIWSLTGALSKASNIKSPHPVRTRFHPGFFHLANVIFHFLTTCLVFLCIKELSFSLLASLFGAIIFTLHPTQVENVVWITGLKDVLAGFFGFASVLLFIRGIQNPRLLRYPLGMLLTFILSILAKSSGVVVIGLEALIGIFLLGKDFKTVLKYLSPLCLACLCLVPVFFILNNPSLTSAVQPQSAFEKIALLTHNIGFYLTKVLYPVHNVFDYGLTPEKVVKEHLYQPQILFLIPLVALALLTDFKNSKKKYIALLLLFILGFIPASGLFSFTQQALSAVADRYLYFSMFAVAVFFAMLIQSEHKIRFALATFFLIFFAKESLALIKVWENDLSFYTNALTYNPNSWLSLNNIGVAYEANHEYEKAYQHYLKAAEVSNHARPWYNAGAMALKLGHYDQAEEAYRKAALGDKKSASAKISLATALALRGKQKEAQAEIANLNIEPLCSNAQLIESKEAIEKENLEKLKTLRSDARLKF